MSRKMAENRTPQKRSDWPRTGDLFGRVYLFIKNFLKRFKRVSGNRVPKRFNIARFQLCELNTFKHVLTVFESLFNTKLTVFGKTAKKGKSLRPHFRGFGKIGLILAEIWR